MEGPSCESQGEAGLKEGGVGVAGGERKETLMLYAYIHKFDDWHDKRAQILTIFFLKPIKSPNDLPEWLWYSSWHP